MITTEGHQALVSIQVPVMKGLSEMKNAILELSSGVKVIANSSVYKRSLLDTFDEVNSNLFSVLHIETQLDQWELQSDLALLPGLWSILAFDQIVSLSPQLPLPNPALFEDKALLRCASEAYAQFNHPVLGQSLNELIRSVHSFEKTEFFAQGRSIL